MKPSARLLRFFLCTAFAMLAASAAARPGDLDLFFNPTGEGSGVPGMVFDVPSDGMNVLYKIALLPDGRIAGVAFSSGYALTGWLPDGSLDPAFGEGGVARPGVQLGLMTGMAVQQDGKILVSGVTGVSGLALRFRSNGTVDRSFGEDGTVMLDMPDAVTYASSLAVMNDGRIVVGGTVTQNEIGASSRPRLWRLLADGSPDQTFGSAGGVTLSGPGNISQIAIQPDGKIVAAGPDRVADEDVWLGRVNTDGSLDSTFKGGGRFLVPFPVSNHGGDSIKVALQSDGKILMAGDFTVDQLNFDFYAARFNNDGSSDSGFGAGGRVTAYITSGRDALNAVSVQADGKVLLAGTSGAGEAVLVRYLTDGTQDNGFGIGGVARFPIPASQGDAQSIAVLPDGKILLGGNAFPGNRVVLMRISGVSLPESLSGEWPAGTPLKSGGTVNLGTVLRGDPAGLQTTVTLRNTGPAPLTNFSAVMGGPGAAQFALLSPLPAVLNSGESVALKVGFLSTSEVAGFAAGLTIETGDPGLGDFLIVLRGETQSPVSTLTVRDGREVIGNNATLEFGPALATHPITKTLTLRSTGNIDLLLQGISLGATGTPGDFTVTPPETDVLSPGASATFDLTFTPAGTGPRTARLRIASTDTFQFPYEITLTGSLVAGIDAWRLTHFGTLLNEGDAADFSDPDGDGIVNLMEYATLTNPNAPDPRAPGEVALSGNLMEYTFIRPAGAADQLIYSMEWSLSPEGPWGGVAPLTVLSNDGARQRVRFSLSVVNSPRRFVRLRVERK
ncbi:MAG TPA: choice-of-anchor D domain-containing protein [Verrucomicrobiales bacterium]|nr:choice-of-anchor D domain-containing protein [Verrucomicrobiales bacterium]